MATTNKQAAESASGSHSALFQLVEVERQSFNLLRDIEQARMELHHSYLEKRMALLAANKDNVEWLLGAMSELRKERVSFQKKSLPEIADALQDGKVPQQQVTDWLCEVSKFYHGDISAAQKLIAIDVAELDEKLFETTKATFSARMSTAQQRQEASDRAAPVEQADERPEDDDRQ